MQGSLVKKAPRVVKAPLPLSCRDIAHRHRVPAMTQCSTSAQCSHSGSTDYCACGSWEESGGGAGCRQAGRLSSSPGCEGGRSSRARCSSVFAFYGTGHACARCAISARRSLIRIAASSCSRARAVLTAVSPQRDVGQGRGRLLPATAQRKGCLRVFAFDRCARHHPRFQPCRCTRCVRGPLCKGQVQLL